MKKKNIGLGSTIDLIELSDAFRRHAKYDEKKTVKKLVAETRKFAAILTNYYSEYDKPGTGSGMVNAFNREVIEGLKESLQRIGKLSAKLGAEAVILPVNNSKHSIDARMINKKVIPEVSLPVKASLQTEAYEKDLSEIGKVDRHRKTVLDEGYHGFAAFRPNFFAVRIG